jgi:hypothetical protein
MHRLELNQDQDAFTDRTMNGVEPLEPPVFLTTAPAVGQMHIKFG